MCARGVCATAPARLKINESGRMVLMASIDGKPRAKGLKLECIKCRYAWAYQGRLRTATCPSCQQKVPVNAHRQEDVLGTQEQNKSVITDV